MHWTRSLAVTLDHELVDDELINDVEYEVTDEETWNPNWNDEDEEEESFIQIMFTWLNDQSSQFL